MTWRRLVCVAEDKISGPAPQRAPGQPINAAALGHHDEVPRTRKHGSAEEATALILNKSHGIKEAASDAGGDKPIGVAIVGFFKWHSPSDSRKQLEWTEEATALALNKLQHWVTNRWGLKQATAQLVPSNLLHGMLEGCV
jgi:hypothetical protein